MADDVIVIDHGRLIRQGTVAELTAGGSHLRVASPDHDALGRALIAAGLEPRADDEGGYLLESADPERIGRIALQAGVALSRLSIEETSLEDAFLEMTEGIGR